MKIALNTLKYYVDINVSVEELCDKMVMAGFEVEYYPKHFEALCEHLAPFKPDYLILGQHFTNNEFDGHYVGRPCNTEMFKSYVSSVITAIESGYFSYIAHPDVVNYSEDEDIYREQMLLLCQKAKELDIPLEINFLGFHEARRYPSERFFKIAAEVGNTVIHGVDAHVPTAFADTAETFIRIEEFRNKFGLALTDEIKLLTER